MAARSQSRCLLVFAKQPVPGRVKTRLARNLGATAAAQLYEAFLRDTLQHCAEVRDVELRLCYTPGTAGAWFAELEPEARCLPQAEGDLGVRLAQAFEQAFSDGARAAVALGSDTPQLDASFLEGALARVAPGRVVLGPSRDGGYTLIGLAAPAPALFERIPWSTPAVLETTEQRARSLGLQVDRLEERYDIDEALDLECLRAQIEAREVDCPATRAALRSRPRP